MSEQWWEQYEERAAMLNEIGQHGAADDIRTLVDGLRQYEAGVTLSPSDVERLRADVNLLLAAFQPRPGWRYDDVSDAHRRVLALIEGKQA